MSPVGGDGVCAQRSVQELIGRALFLEKQALREEDGALRSSLIEEAAALRSEVWRRLERCGLSRRAKESGNAG